MTRSELAVILATVVLLGFMLVPAKRQQHGPLMSNCVGNMRQLGNAGFLYQGENKEVWPGPQPLGADVPEISWDRPLAIQAGANLGTAGIYEPLARLTRTPAHAAAKTLATFTCPADPQDRGASSIPVVLESFADGTADGKGICRSYVMNLGSGNLVEGMDDGIAPAAAAVPLKKIQSAAGTVQLIESHGYATVFGQRNLANDTYMTCDRTGSMTPKDAFTNPKAPMHGLKSRSRFNALMYDGHVEPFEPTTITANKGEIMQYTK